MNLQQRIQHEAGLYMRSKDMFDSLSPQLLQEVRQLVSDRYAEIRRPIAFVEEELNDFEEVKKAWQQGVLYISNLNNNSRLFPGVLNLKFRAWHDVLHLENDLPFNYEGEYGTFLYHAAGVKDETIRKIFYSEVVLQTAYYETYKQFPEDQKIVLTEIPE